MKSLTLQLPWPPSVNHYWGDRVAGGNGKQWVSKYLTADARRYKVNVQAAIWGTRGVTEPLLGRLKIDIAAYPPDNRKRDLDNILKSLFDALKDAKVFVDDSQIDDLHVVRKSRHTNGCVIVTIEQIPEPLFEKHCPTCGQEMISEVGHTCPLGFTS